MAIKRFKIEASEQAKQLAKKPVKASDGEWDKAVISFIDTIPELPEQGKVISKTYKGWPIVIVGLGNGKCLYQSYLKKANAASDIQFIRGLIKRGDAPEKAVENLGFKTYTRGDVEGACGGKKKPVKSAAGKKRWGLYSDFGQRILNETFDSKREAQKAFREYGYTKDSEAWIEEVDETAVGKFDKKPANSACGGKKSVKSSMSDDGDTGITFTDDDGAILRVVKRPYGYRIRRIKEFADGTDYDISKEIYDTAEEAKQAAFEGRATYSLKGRKSHTPPPVKSSIKNKSIKSSAKKSVKCAADNADLERAKQNIVDGYNNENDKDYTVDEYFADEDLNRVPILYTTLGDENEHDYQLYADLVNPKIIVEIDGETIYEDNFPNIGALADDLEDFDWDNWYSYYLRYVPDEIVYGEEVNGACGGKKSVKSSARKSARKTVRASKRSRSVKAASADGYKFAFYRDGYRVLSKTENNRGKWLAQKDDEEPFEITYEQARGFEPIDPRNRALQMKLGKALKLPIRSSAVKAAKKDDMNKEAHKWYNTSLTKDEYAKFRKFLKENGYKYEPSEEGQNTYVKVYLTKADADKVNKFLDSMDDVESACGGKKSKKTVKASAAAKRRAKKSVKASKYYEITDHYNDEVGRADTEDEARELAKKLIRENDVDHYDIFWVDTDPDSTDDTSYIDTVYADKPFSVEGYLETNFRGLSDSDTFYELRDALDYAQELLGKGLSVRMECENAGGRLEITPDEYDEFVQTSDGAIFEDMPEVAEWLHQVQVERMDSYQEPWLDNWQYNTDIGMSTKYAKRGKKPVKADFNDIEDIEDFYDGENFDSTKALGAFNSDTAPYDVNTTVAEYITDNYGIYAESVSYVEYNGPGDWVVDMSQSGQAVADDFVYFLSEKDYDLSLKLYGESETDASGYDMAKYYGDSAIHGNDFQFQFYPAQNQWSAPQVDVDINELIQIGLTQEEANRVVDLVAEYEQNYISICQDINYYIESFLKELSEEEVKASTGVKAALGNKNKTDYASNPIYELDKYVKDLAEGVAAAAGITLTYQVSDEAITFIDGDGTAVFIQPISEITPEPDDLENDIQELVSAIQYEDSDNPEYWPTDTTEDDPDYATRAVQMSVDDELEPVMGEGEDIGYGIDSYGETIDESTVNELYRMAERDILPNTELAKIDPYVSIDEDSWDFYFGGVSNTGMMGVVKFYIHFKLTSDNIDLNEFVIPEARLYPDFKYYTASLDFDIYTENGKVTDVVLESADIYKSDNSYDTYQSDKFKEAFNVEAIENYIEKLAAPAVEEIYNAVSNL